MAYDVLTAVLWVLFEDGVSSLDSLFQLSVLVEIEELTEQSRFLRGQSSLGWYAHRF